MASLSDKNFQSPHEKDLSADFQEIAAEEGIRTVYRTVVLGVAAASTASLVLVVTLLKLGDTSWWRGCGFAAYIGVCAIGHIALSCVFKRYAEHSTSMRGWGVAFAAVCLLEGIGWGWAPIGLVSKNAFEAELLCLLVSIGCAAGSLPAFGSYLPAFIVFFFPATVPYVLYNAASQEPIRQAATLLMLLYILGIGIFGVILHRTFANQVFLRKHAEVLADELRVQVTKVEAANLAKSTFLAAASHDLRQPVHALSLFVGALAGSSLSSEAREIVQHIDRSAHALDDLFAALLDISKLDAGSVEVVRRAFAVAPMLDRLCLESKDSASEKAVRVNTRYSGADNIVVNSDPVLVERILRNLIVNAVRYTKKGRILLTCRRRAGAVFIEIWDTGPGIALEEQEAIFQEYYQLENPERDRKKGLGLGLAIVKRLSNLLESELTLRSKLGRGSVFSLRLPAASVADLHSDVDAEPRHLTCRTIVVIDDELDIRIGMTTVLERWGHKVIAVTSGADAVAALADYPIAPHLIVADFRLRGSESGIDAVEKLRSEYNAKIPAILISGDTAPERLKEAHKSGLLLIHKPVSNSRLRAAITHTLLTPPDP